MSERVPIGKKLRFEVFKRDNFTCMYCGAKAPNALLHVDHIKPVAEGGETDILNLITACQDCNLGKGARPLADHQVINQTLDQMAELEERRQQLQMMVQWQEELRGIEGSELEAVEKKIFDRTGFALNEAGRADVRRWLKRNSLAELLRATDESFDTYLRFDGDTMIEVSWGKAFSKIPAVSAILRQEESKPYLRQLLYIQGIIRKRSRAYRYDCIGYLEHLVVNGFDIDELEARAKRLRTIKEFEAPLDEWLDSIGEPY